MNAHAAVEPVGRRPPLRWWARVTTAAEHPEVFAGKSIGQIADHLETIIGGLDHTVPWAIVNASYKQQQDNPGVTEIVKIKGRGHALTIDSGWREVADTALAFVQSFT